MAEGRFARNIRHVHHMRLSDALTRPAMLPAFRPPSIQVENELLATPDAHDGSPKSNMCGLILIFWRCYLALGANTEHS